MARNKFARKTNKTKELSIANKEVAKAGNGAQLTKTVKRQIKKDAFQNKIQAKYGKKQLNAHTTDQIDDSTEALLKQYNESKTAKPIAKDKPKQKKTPKLSVLEKNTHANISSLSNVFGNIF